MQAFEGARVIATGTAHGIGKAIAEAFHGRGGSVALLDIQGDALQEACDYLGSRAIPVAADVSDFPSFASGMDQAIRGLDGIDIAIAGIHPSHRALELTPEAWDRIMSVNARGAFFTCQAAARAMVKNKYGGTVVTMASGSTRFVLEGTTHYWASNATVVTGQDLPVGGGLSAGCYGISDSLAEGAADA